MRYPFTIFALAVIFSCLPGKQLSAQKNVLLLSDWGGSQYSFDPDQNCVRPESVVNLCSSEFVKTAIARFRDTVYYAEDHGSNNTSLKVSVDIESNGCTELEMLTGRIDALTVDRRGMLYWLTGSQLIRYNPHTKQKEILGNINIPFSPNGDMVFFSNRLYLAATGGIAEIDIANPAASKIVLPTPNAEIIGIISVGTGCFSSKLYGFEWADGRHYVLELDIAQAQFRRTGCSFDLNGQKLLDAASIAESSDFSALWIKKIQVSPQCGEPPQLGGVFVEMTVANRSSLPFVYKLKSSDTLYEFISEKEWLSGGYKNVMAESIKPGSYTVTVTTQSGCSVDSVFTIRQVPAVTAKIEDIPDTCSRGIGGVRIKMGSGTAPFTYQLGDIIQTDSLFTKFLRGGYTLTITDSNRCRQQHLVTVIPIVPPLPISGLTITASKGCGTQGTGEIRFTYLPNARVFSVQMDENPPMPVTNHFTGLPAGQHRLRLQNATCLFDTLINVPAAVGAGPSVQFNKTQPDCKINTGILELVISNIAGPYTINYHNTVFTSTTRFTNLAPGEHVFLIKDANGCEWKFSDTILPHVPMVPSIDSAVSNNACQGRGSIRLAMAGPEAPYRFEVDGSLYNSGAQSVDLVSGTYTITIYNAERCAVYAMPFTVPSRAGCDTIQAIYVPSAFTPNGDGKNDKLEPLGNPLGKVVRFVFRVYNRSGQVVFESRTPGNGWDGKCKGIQQPSATYVWVFQGTDPDGKPVNYKGTTVLIR